jgi:pyruvate dehydrogenase E2 component (dihydrolipoamide acetyltransferase)
MAVPVIMPRQGQSVETCILGEWFFKKGDSVKAGDILFSYETDKASFEEEAKEDGVLLDIFFEEGDEVPVLVNIAVIGSEGENADDFKDGGEAEDSVADSSEKEEAVEVVVEAEAQKAPASEAQTSVEGEVKISPRARLLAESKKVPVNMVKGTGPGGRIIERDIEAAVKANLTYTSLAAEKASGDGLFAGKDASGLGGRFAGGDLVAEEQAVSGDFEIKKLPNIRKIIAKAMHESLQNSAQLTHHMGADARKLLASRKMFKAELSEGKRKVNITINDMVCWAVVRALEKFPQVNSHFLGDSMKLFSDVHLGLAVDTDRGLMVPAIKDANKLTLEGLASNMKKVAEQCKKGSVNPELLSPKAASFTVSNLGNYGVEIFTPVINLPQSAILGVNTILPRPADLGNGVFGFVPTIGLSLTYDHQALDGGEASRFLYEIKTQIENLDF